MEIRIKMIVLLAKTTVGIKQLISYSKNTLNKALNRYIFFIRKLIVKKFSNYHLSSLYKLLFTRTL